MKTVQHKVIFKSYENGYYTFRFEDGLDMIFEEVHPRIRLKYDLIHDKSMINKTFHLTFSERFEDDDENLMVYKIEYLENIKTKI
jgi:hypothetical protein